MRHLLTNIFRSQRVAVVQTIGLSLIVYVLVSVPPVVLGRFVDQSLAATVADFHLLALIVLIAGVALGLERLLSYLLTTLSSRLIQRQYMQSVADMLGKERKLFERVKIGEIIDLFSRFINGYENVFTSLIATCIPSALAAIIVLITIGIVSTPLVLSVVLGVQIILFAAVVYLLKRYSADLQRYTVGCYELSDAWVEILGSNKIIQGECSFEQALGRLDAYVATMARRFVQKNRSHDQVTSFVTFGQTMALLTVILVLVYYLRLGEVTVGGMLTVITLNYILQAHMRVISEFLVKIRNFRTACHDFERVASAPSYQQERSVVLAPIGDITIAPTTIAKAEHTILTLEQPFVWTRGERICVLGLSGAGKSTFFSIFFNAHREYQSLVRVNGMPASAIDSAQYQQRVRISFQENEILSGAGYATWFQREVDPVAARALLQSLQLPDDIISGERTLEPWSGNISGGEAKRLNVARLLMMPGDYNILDEPTTGLNVSLSRQTWELIFDRLDGRSLMCATHDLTFIEHFDRVIIIDGGRLVADTVPANLEGNPHFAKIRGRL